MSKMDELQREFKAILKKYEGHSIVPKMRENECDVIVRMNKCYVTKVIIVTCNGISNVVTVPVPREQAFVIPIATVDGVIDLRVGVMYR